MKDIYECYDGTFIDLSKIIAINKFDYDKIGIWFQLRKEPVILSRWKKDGGSLLDNGWNDPNANMLKEVEKLIDVWCEYKKGVV